MTIFIHHKWNSHFYNWAQAPKYCVVLKMVFWVTLLSTITDPFTFIIVQAYDPFKPQSPKSHNYSMKNTKLKSCFPS